MRGLRSRELQSATRDNGFTMVEMLVALSLLGMVMTALVPVFMAGLRTASISNGRTDGTAVATKEIEAIRALPYASIGFYNNQPGYEAGFGSPTAETVTLGTTAPAGTLLTPIGPDVAIGSRRFTVRRHIVWEDATDGTLRTQAYKRAYVEVAWDNGGVTRTIRQDSVFYPGGLGKYTTAKNNNGYSVVPPPGAGIPPSAPTLNAAVVPPAPDGESQVGLSWTRAATGGEVDHWIVQWSQDPSFGTALQASPSISGNSTSYTVGSLNSSTLYYFRVLGYTIENLVSPPSNSVSATTRASGSPACAVTGLNLVTSATSSTSKTYLDNQDRMTENLTLTATTNGNCTGAQFKVKAVGPLGGTQDPGSPYDLGAFLSVTVSTNNQTGWSPGTHTFSVVTSSGPVSPAVEHSFLVCAQVPNGQRSNEGNRCSA